MKQGVIRYSLIAWSLAIAGLAQAVEPVLKESELPVLSQESQHATASKRITNLFTRSHYKQFKLDAAFSAEIFDKYLEALDYSRNLFLASDIQRFEKYRKGFDKDLERGRLDPAYDMFNLSQQRRYERYEYALTLLDTPFDFTQKDEYLFDREGASWPTSEGELNELWRQRVKYDALSLKLSGKEWPEIKELLAKRYNNAIKRMSQTESEDVFQLFMNSFARAIEPHTSYLSPRNADRFNSEMNLSLEGIGAVLQAEDDFTVIRSLVPGGPAANSNQLKPDDKITGVGQADGKIVDVIGWRLDEVVDLIKGPKGSKVRLEIQRGKGATAKTEVIELVRDKVRLEDRAAKSKVVMAEGKKIGVLEIPSFYVNLHEDVIKELASLNKKKIDGLVVDLRGNGGGALTEASALTGLFITAGPVVQIRDHMGRVTVNGDDDGQVYYGGPMTVLIDRYSASASEIFAAAMQDYGRALIIGENSFGKGTVQQHRSLAKVYDFYDEPLGHVQYTIAKFYRIDGGSTQNKGVVPDIAFPTAIPHEETGESQEPNALPWDKIASASYQRVGNFTAQLPTLKQAYEKRVASDPEFAYVEQDIAEYKREKDKKSVSLNEAERRAEQEKQDALALVRTNERLKRMGKPQVKSLDELPSDYEAPDEFLKEAANITADLGKLTTKS
ncbi:carboxy terminal-processing peptidase [Aeromonas schubertii]|uniref:Carboxy terminal-processing peptidase n=1 Tax=Aeromonas schubertii TaxID=652 RepID=A0ABS7VH07_9GAMM|nr:carboxy terminal-processing peptidase [Aeromonas schubertii]MBZ6068326.1 carboxy terminal-processing peptidase [Aeromonas schubertii]QCG48331.1 carboxy terminal-processing peptidase [Aeromonas schubertii]